MSTTTYTSKKARSLVRKAVKTDDALGTKYVPDGYIVGDLYIEIDFKNIIAFMGDKALHNKGHVCRDGYVTVRARNVKREAAS